MIIVREYDAATAGYQDLVAAMLAQVEDAEARFQALWSTFAARIGRKTDLRLRWGVVRVEVKSLGNGDYVNPNVDKCARLCDVAQPSASSLTR